MKNILLTGQLIWDALQADSSDFDVLWEVLRSHNVQGYITQTDLDTLYRKVAQEQDAGIAFGIIDQLQRVLQIYSPNRSHSIDIEINDALYQHSVAVELAETSVLSLQGFLERYALEMLYTDDTLADDNNSNTGMQQWYRKWRQSGFDLLWLVPVILAFTLEGLPFFQKMVANLFHTGEDEQAPRVPQVADDGRGLQIGLAPNQTSTERSPSADTERSPIASASPSQPSHTGSHTTSAPSRSLSGGGDRLPLVRSEYAAAVGTAVGSEQNRPSPSPTISAATPQPTNGSIPPSDSPPSTFNSGPPLSGSPHPVRSQGNQSSPSPPSPQSGSAPDNDPPNSPTPNNPTNNPAASNNPSTLNSPPPAHNPPITNTPDPLSVVTPLPPVRPPDQTIGEPSPSSPLVDPINSTVPPTTPPTPPPSSPNSSLNIAGDGVMNIPDDLLDPSPIPLLQSPFQPNRPINSPDINSPQSNVLPGEDSAIIEQTINRLDTQNDYGMGMGQPYTFMQSPEELVQQIVHHPIFATHKSSLGWP